MAANAGWFDAWFANGWFPAVWFAPGDESGVPPEELQQGFGSFAFVAPQTKKLRRKRVFIDGKEYFLNPLEAANLLIEKSKKAESIKDDAVTVKREIVQLSKPSISDEVTSRFDIRASQVFIDRMNAEINRMNDLAIRRKIEEEDDIECLMLLI